MSTALSTMAGKLASRLGMDAGTDLMNTLKIQHLRVGMSLMSSSRHC